MKFAVTSPAFILGQYIVASPQQPAVIELPEDIKVDHVAFSWQPIDKKAYAFLKAAGADVKKFHDAFEGKDAPGTLDAPDGAQPVKVTADEDDIQVTKVPTGKLPGA